MKERQVWIDMLKGYGIIVVTLGHLGIAFLVEKHIYSYHMFLFFLISGYLFSERTFFETLKKKTHSLLIPFLMWDFVSSMLGALMNHQNFKNFLVTLFVLNGNLCFNAPIWFLLILFLTEVIYSYIGNKINIGDVVLVFISVIMFILFGSNKLPFKVNLLPLAMFSYVTGALLKKYNVLVGGGWLIVLAFTSITFGTFLNSRISYTAGNFGNIFFCIVAAYSGMFFFFFLFNIAFKKCKENILSYIGKNSFSIMVMQYFFFSIYNKIGQIFFGIDDIWHMINSVKAICLTILTIFIILMFVEVFKKMTKGTMLEKIGKLFGI